ncbi:uncharacterized protein SPPG_08030 [Spizellomyces punctatus DAOM BR117]|uniref:Cyclin N-terminal domain-containing protein n=1 Tax=Spizellomyces punctatus (strain DAOM BR117) TaxID=645134 RepID=A0A0L0H5E0_SPIPD|nr:uncharacterized protein SPPG_08030 [Spizellomyces punctatus DAOM BR117]KNC96437.1 hypothetical protein SPPG_08030 [Spizellomyces punctatus DAOM BR117]|eukprot:XP_016604477.1 hypothetical protein SPPG_08030 [Spizellomyces punctatus DAOM BR117]
MASKGLLPSSPHGADRKRPPSLRTSKTTNSSKSSYARVSRLVATVVHVMVHHLSLPPDSFLLPEHPSQWLTVAKQTQSTPAGRPPAALSVFAQRLISGSKLSLPVILVALKYVERFLHRKRERAGGAMMVDNHVEMHMEPGNVVSEGQRAVSGDSTSEFGVLVAALAAANKFLDDSRYSNRWWAKVAQMPLDELNGIEMGFLAGISFDLYVPEAEYVEWVTAMQKFARWLEEQAVTSTPINDAAAPPLHTPHQRLSRSSTSSSTSHSTPSSTLNPIFLSPNTPTAPIAPAASATAVVSPLPSPVPAALPLGMSWNNISPYLPSLSSHHVHSPASPADASFIPQAGHPRPMSYTSSPISDAASLRSTGSSTRISSPNIIATTGPTVLVTSAQGHTNLGRSGAVRKKRADPLLGVRNPHHPHQHRVQPYHLQIAPAQSDHNYFPPHPPVSPLHHRASMCSVSSSASLSSMSSSSTTSTFEAFLYQQTVLEKMLEGRGRDSESVVSNSCPSVTSEAPSVWSMGTASSFGSNGSSCPGLPETTSLPRWYKQGDDNGDMSQPSQVVEATDGKGWSLPRWFRVEDGQEEKQGERGDNAMEVDA